MVRRWSLFVAVFFFGVYLGLIDLLLRLGVDNIFKLFR